MIFTKYVGPCLAECTAVFIFVWIGVMSSVNESVLAVAAAHGLTIAFLVTAFGKIRYGISVILDINVCIRCLMSHYLLNTIIQNVPIYFWQLS